MPKTKLTPTGIRHILKTPPGSRVEHWDAGPGAAQGLCLRITSKGSASWHIRYRRAGTHRRYRIGLYSDALGLSEARKRARAIKAQVDAGEDPQQIKEDERTLEKPLTVKEAAELYITKPGRRKKKPLRQSTKDQIQWIMENRLIPKLGRKALESVRDKDIIRILDDLETRHLGPNLAFRQFRAFFNWAVDKRYIDESPMRRIKQPEESGERDRCLEYDELADLWTALEAEAYPWGPFVKLLILTAQRRSEVAKMEWKHMDLEQKIWTIPASLSKNGLVHDVPLSPEAVAVIEGIAKQSSRYVFTTTSGRQDDDGRDISTPISGFSRTKRRIEETIAAAREKDKRDPIEESWQFHDLRRTAATGMAGMGFPVQVVEKVLNHSSGAVSGLAAVYNRHSYKEEMRTALEAWSRHAANITNPKPDNVVEMQQAAK